MKKENPWFNPLQYVSRPMQRTFVTGYVVVSPLEPAADSGPLASGPQGMTFLYESEADANETAEILSRTAGNWIVIPVSEFDQLFPGLVHTLTPVAEAEKDLAAYRERLRIAHKQILLLEQKSDRGYVVVDVLDDIEPRSLSLDSTGSYFVGLYIPAHFYEPFGGIYPTQDIASEIADILRRANQKSSDVEFIVLAIESYGEFFGKEAVDLPRFSDEQVALQLKIGRDRLAELGM